MRFEKLFCSHSRRSDLSAVLGEGLVDDGYELSDFIVRCAHRLQLHLAVTLLVVHEIQVPEDRERNPDYIMSAAVDLKTSCWVFKG